MDRPLPHNSVGIMSVSTNRVIVKSLIILLQI